MTRTAATILVLLPLCITGRALLTGGVFGPIDLPYATEPLASIADEAGITHVTNPAISDVAAQFIPWSRALRQSVADHEWPLWNRFELCGNPLAGAAQIAAYHPITLLGLLIPLPDAVTFAASMVFFLAALSAFLLLRGFVDNEIAVLFGAAAWMLSTHLVSFSGTAHAMSISILPLVLTGGRAIVRDPSKRSALFLGIALLLLVLSGHPESALHVVALACAYVVFEIVGRWRFVRLRAVLVTGLGTGIATLLVCAIFLLPVLDAIPQTAEFRHREIAQREKSSSVPMMLHRLRANAFPFLEGAPGVEEHSPEIQHGWLATSYAGSLLFAPALFALWRSRLRERWFFAGAVVWGLLTGISAPGITELLEHVPLFSMAVNDRMITFAALGFCALAAIGIDAWMRERSHALPILAIALGITILFLSTSALDPTYVHIGAARAAIPLLLGAAALFVTPRHAAAILLALLLVQRVGEIGGVQPTLPRRAFYPPFPGLEVMKSNEPFRIVAIGSMFPPAVATHYGLEDARGFQAMTLAQFRDAYDEWSVHQHIWSNRVDDLRSPFLSKMNVRFAIVPTNFALPEGWITRATQPNYAILENTRVLPRAYSAEGTITIRAEGSRLHLHASMPRDGRVIVSNAVWKGWQAVEDHHRLPLKVTNRTFFSFPLSAGEHDIEVFYRPRSFVIGAWISAIAAFAIALGYTVIPSSVITFFMSFQTSFFAAGLRRR
ncbi:MAG TPA: YfhO family protein [Thermoanaerobaculia bacterium]|nr:YfhO family protein [Thermoanaerobaculia bacterium]